jgi:hypothetical protein
MPSPVARLASLLPVLACATALAAPQDGADECWVYVAYEPAHPDKKGGYVGNLRWSEGGGFDVEIKVPSQKVPVTQLDGLADAYQGSVGQSVTLHQVSQSDAGENARFKYEVRYGGGVWPWASTAGIQNFSFKGKGCGKFHYELTGGQSGEEMSRRLSNAMVAFAIAGGFPDPRVKASARSVLPAGMPARAVPRAGESPRDGTSPAAAVAGDRKRLPPPEPGAPPAAQRGTVDQRGTAD